MTSSLIHLASKYPFGVLRSVGAAVDDHDGVSASGRRPGLYHAPIVVAPLVSPGTPPLRLFPPDLEDASDVVRVSVPPEKGGKRAGVLESDLDGFVESLHNGGRRWGVRIRRGDLGWAVRDAPVPVSFLLCAHPLIAPARRGEEPLGGGDSWPRSPRAARDDHRRERPAADRLPAAIPPRA